MLLLVMDLNAIPILPHSSFTRTHKVGNRAIFLIYFYEEKTYTLHTIQIESITKLKMSTKTGYFFLWPHLTELLCYMSLSFMTLLTWRIYETLDYPKQKFCCDQCLMKLTFIFVIIFEGTIILHKISEIHFHAASKQIP